MIAVLCLFALLGNALAVYVPSYGVPVAGYPTVPAAGYPTIPAISTVHATPVAVTPTVHNVETPYGYRTTGVSYSHRVEPQPLRVAYGYGLTPYGLKYGYGLGAYGYTPILKTWYLCITNTVFQY
ncbi:hypothetical protein V5799_026086 [Amblyomma americanum]|uniref:Secreted protein n=1 Tax=Amblyomma americanum TaxID=6943 RepID=A0AAQ4DJL1_AMBAM